MKCSLGISNVLEEITILLFSSISLHWSLRKAFLPLLAVLWNSAFRWVSLCFSPLPFTSLLFTAICKASSDSHFAFSHFFFLGMVLIPVSYTMSWTSVHSSSGTLSIRSNLLNLFVTSTVQSLRDLIKVIPEWSCGFPYFLQFKSEFGNKEFMIWATISSWSCFCQLYNFSPSLAAKNGSIEWAKARPGAACGSDHELLVAKFRLKLK